MVKNWFDRSYKIKILYKFEKQIIKSIIKYYVLMLKHNINWMGYTGPGQTAIYFFNLKDCSLKSHSGEKK